MKFKRIILFSLALLVLLSSVLTFTSCGKKEAVGCQDSFIDENHDGVCDKCKYMHHPCTFYGEEHDLASGKCKVCKYNAKECIWHEDYLHDDNLCDKCGAYCTKFDEFVGRIKLFGQSFFKDGGYKETISGLLITIEIAVLGLLIGVLIGTLLAVFKVVPKTKKVLKVIAGICDVYVGFFRGTPMVVQLLIGYFVILPLFNISLGINPQLLSPLARILPAEIFAQILKLLSHEVVVAILIFGLNSGAYVSEIMRSGINSIDKGQLEAGRAVGLPYSIAMLKIVIPQSIKNILPTLGNEFIVLVKETSVVSFITVVDLTKALKIIGDATYEFLVPYVVLALIYLVLVVLITIGVKQIERRLKRDER